MLRADLGDFIRSKRQAALLSQEELALKADITVRTIWALEASGTKPNFKTLRAVAQVLEIDPREFVEMPEEAAS